MRLDDVDELLDGDELVDPTHLYGKRCCEALVAAGEVVG